MTIKLKVLYNIFQIQESTAAQDFDELTDEEIILFLLTVEVTVTYNKKNTTVGIEQPSTTQHKIKVD